MYNGSKTALFCFSILLISALYDLTVLVFWKQESFISQWIADTSGLSPFQLIVCGVMIDHFFGWTMKRQVVKCPCGIIFNASTGKEIK